jgi:hypothetical protein
MSPGKAAVARRRDGGVARFAEADEVVEDEPQRRIEVDRHIVVDFGGEG